MTLKEAIDYVSYFMDDKQASGDFAEAWKVIFNELAESTNSSHNRQRTAIVARAKSRVTPDSPTVGDKRRGRSAT